MGLIQSFATPNEISVIDSIRKIHYSNEIIVPIQVYSLIIERQPKSISIFTENGNIAGYFALIAMEEMYFLEMKKGQLNEKQLDNITYIPKVLTDNEFNDKYIYVLSIVSADVNSKLLNHSLMLKLKERINYLCDTFSVKGVFAHFENDKLKRISQNNFQVINI